jgi:hypothetical protein
MVLSEGLSFTGLMREVGMKPEAYPEDTRTFVICNCVFARDGKMVHRFTNQETTFRRRGCEGVVFESL